MIWATIRKRENLLVLRGLFWWAGLALLAGLGGCAPFPPAPPLPPRQLRTQPEIPPPQNQPQAPLLKPVLPGQIPPIPPAPPTLPLSEPNLPQPALIEKEESEPNQLAPMQTESPPPEPISLERSARQMKPIESIQDVSLAQRYGQVSPRQLDESLSDEQLFQMFARPEEIPTVELWNQADPNRMMPPLPASPAEPNNITARKAYLQGRRLLIQGQYLPSRQYLLQAQDADPNNAAIYELLAQAQLNLGDSQAAALSARRAVELDHNRLLAYQLLGGQFMNQGDYLRAASAFGRALTCRNAAAGNPITAVLHLQLAQTLEQLGYLSAAVRHYQSSFQMLQNQSRFSQTNALISRLVRQRHLYLLNMAALQVQMGLIAEAQRSLQLARDDLPGGEDLMRAFIMSLSKQRIGLDIRYRQVSAFCRYLLALNDRTEPTLEAFYEACREMARENDYLNVLHAWYETVGGADRQRLLNPREYAYGLAWANENETAKNLLLEQLTLAPDNGLVHRDLARLYEKSRHWREVIYHLGGYLQSDPQITEELINQLQQKTTQIPELESKLQQWPQDEQLIGAYGSVFLLGCLARNQQENDLALWCCRRALQLQPDFIPGHRYFVELLLELHENQQVLDWIEKNAGLVRTEPAMLGYAGRAYMQLGQWDQAAAYLRRFIEQHQDDVGAYLALAEVLAHQGALAQAEEILLQVSADQPGHRQLEQQLLLLYARWGAQENLTDQFRPAAEKRAQELLTQWLLRRAAVKTGLPVADPVNEQDQQHLLTEMEILAAEYPQASLLWLMLGRLYFDQGSTDQALRQIERVLNDNPHNEEALALAASFNEAAGDWKRAARLRRQIWRLHEDDPKLLAVALSSLRRADQAAEALKLLLSVISSQTFQNAPAIEILYPEALRLFIITRQHLSAADLFQRWYEYLRAADEEMDRLADPTDPAYRLGESLLWAFTEAGLFEQALQHAQSLHQRYRPKQALMALYLSNMLNVRFQYDKSRQLLEKLVELQPDDLPLRLQWYYTIIEQGRPEAAEALARQWLEQQPEQRQRRNALVLLLHRAGNFKTAADQHRLYLQANLNDENLKLDLVDTLIRGGAYQEAEDVLFGAEARKNRSSVWLDLRVKLDIARGDWKAALSLIDEMTQGSTSLQIEMLRVQVLEAAGETAPAVEKLKNLIDQNPQPGPDDLNRRIQYGFQLERLGHKTAAIDQMESLHREYPDDPLIKNNLGYTLIEAHQQTERARRLVEEALRADPESAPTLDSVGWFYYKKGEFTRALDYLYQSVARTPQPDPDILSHLGDTMYRLGRKKQAEIFWTRSLAQVQIKLPLERYLEGLKVKLEEKLRQLANQEKVTVAELFE